MSYVIYRISYHAAVPFSPSSYLVVVGLRVFGLVVDPEVLAEHRDDRRNIAKYGMQAAYSNLKQVMAELEEVEVCPTPGIG